MVWYHGGIPGLKVGDRLVPPSEHGKQATLSQYAAQIDNGQIMRQDRVYLTSAKDHATVYAAMYPDGAVYEATPDEGYTDDPDCSEPGLSIEATGATITKVIRAKVPLTPEIVAAIAG